MALQPNLLATTMWLASGLPTPYALKEFQCYATGVCEGLKLGTAQIQTAGIFGSPGQGQMITVLGPNSALMTGIVATNSIGIIPPVSIGTPQPAQFIWYQAIAQIADHIALFLQVDSLPADTVSVGTGVIPPGGFTIDETIIKALIIKEYLAGGFMITPLREQIAGMIGKSTADIMKLATMTIPIIGGAPSGAPPPPSAGTRTGVIS